MSERADSKDSWDATWEGARRQLLESTLAATPAQRLDWLEEMLELAHRSGALERLVESRQGTRGRRNPA
jgi:hypothetical protein